MFARPAWRFAEPLPSFVRRARLFAALAAALIAPSGCAHEGSSACGPRLATSRPGGDGQEAATRASAEEPSEELTLYELRWLLGTGESGALTELPATVHPFTLGRWECAVGPELAEDALAEGRAEVRRSRKLVCTHASGLTMQTMVACGYAMPTPSDGTGPRASAREARVLLSEAPAVSVSCDPAATDVLTLYQGEREPLVTACVRRGRVEPCEP